MPPRGRARRRTAALRHGAQLASDFVTLWLTEHGERVLLIGPHIRLDGHVFVARPGGTHGDAAWEVGLAGYNTTKQPGQLLPLRFEVPIEREARKAAAAAFKLGGEKAVSDLLRSAVPYPATVDGTTYRDLSPTVHLPLFHQRPTELGCIPSWFPSSGHSAPMWNRLSLVDERGVTRPLRAGEGHIITGPFSGRMTATAYPVRKGR